MTKESLYGIHAVSAALDSEELLELWVATERRTDDRVASLLQKATEQHLPVHEWRSTALGRRLNTDKHQGVGGLLRAFPGQDYETIL
ncbi:MAG: RNA methyltransferase substrate-binding domain-containing protein, partial [Acidithiobacillus sp.]